jgi:LemA protein
MPALLILGIVALVVIWIAASYNRLAALRNQAASRWQQIDAQRTRRHDLIPSLVIAVRGSMDFEFDTLAAVADARSKALTASGPADAADKEGQLSQAVGRLLTIAGHYPTLKSNDNVKTLREQLKTIENTVRVARQSYNDVAARFNRAQRAFPAALFGGAFGFSPLELFESPDALDDPAAAVELSGR